MRTRISTVLLLLSALVVAACGAAATDGAAAATVNGHEIPRDVLERVVRAQLDGQGTDPESLSAEERAEIVGPLQRDVLTSLIRFQVIATLAEEQGIEVTDERLQQIRDEEVEAAGSEEAYADLVASTGLTDEEFTNLVIADLVRRELLIESVSGEVGEDELREAYEAQLESRYTTRTVRHVLVETQEEADQVVADIEAGEDFGDVARARSQDPGSAEAGGQLPPATRGQYVPEFDEAVWTAQIGELVGPVETDFGFHVLEVLSEDVTTFDEAEADLRAEMEGGQSNVILEGLLAEAYQNADITVASDLGEWDAQQQRVVRSGVVGDGTEGAGVPAPVGEDTAPADQ